jgi:hypothetical protein
VSVLFLADLKDRRRELKDMKTAKIAIMRNVFKFWLFYYPFKIITVSFCLSFLLLLFYRSIVYHASL